jgi:hypothetical protein
VFQQRNRPVTAATTAAGIQGLWRMFTQTLRIRVRQRGIRSRRAYIYWTNFDQGTQPGMCSLMSYIDGLDFEELAPNLD